MWTWRRNRLSTEIYCDIGGLIACGDRDATIRGLVKSLVDFKDADAASYLKQAEELLAKGPGASRGSTHPELHARVLAVANAASMEPGAFDALVHGLISGKLELGELDLFDQGRLGAITRQMIDRLMSEPDARSDLALAHARQMCADYAPPEAPMPPLDKIACELSESTIDYLAYLLLDFSTVEDTGARGPIAAAATVADELGIGSRFREVARAELKGRRAILAGLMPRAA